MRLVGEGWKERWLISSPQVFSSAASSSQSWSWKSWNATQQKGDHCSQGKEYRYVAFRSNRVLAKNEIVQDTERRVSAWFNLPLLSCRRQQGYLYLITYCHISVSNRPDCLVPEGFTARVMLLQTPPLSPGYTLSQYLDTPLQKGNLNTMPNLIIDPVCSIFFLFSGWTKRMLHSHLWWRISDSVICVQ